MEIMKEMEEVRIRKVGVLSVANISGVIYAIIGFLMGLVVVILGSDILVPLGLGTLSYLSIIILPIIYGIIGFVGGAIIALLYNLAAKITKGIKLYS